MEEKLKVIIGLLIKKTKSKQIKWSQVNENSYCVNFNENKIAISNQMVSFREKRKTTLLILNSNQEVISTLDDDKDKDIKELFRLAHQNYYNLDDAMDRIIQQLI